MTAVDAFVNAHVRRVEPLLRDANLAMWDAATTGSEEANERAALLRAEIMRIYANRSEYEQLRVWDQAPPADPALARQVRLLRLAYAQGQQDEQTIEKLTELEKGILAAFVNFRGIYQGRPLSDNELVNVLSTEQDSALLREAWEATKQIGAQVADKVLQAVALRNAAARKMGYDNYYSQSLALSEIDEERLFGILDDLRRLTDEPFGQMKAELDAALSQHYGVAADQLRPWHFQDPFFQRPPKIGSASLDPLFAGKSVEDLAVRTYDGVGLDVRDVIGRSDLYARPGKDQHAFCIHIDRRGDVRVLCNLESDERWMETMLHELGHAVYDKYLGDDLPFLLRDPAHTLSTEAIAMLMGRLPLNREWLIEVAGVSAAEAGALGEQARTRQRLGMLIFVRWVLVMTHFERELYRDPSQGLDSLWWDLVERFQLVRRPEGRNAPDWAAKIHLALYPAYYQNYLLGELMASHLQRWLTARAGGLVGRPAAGQLLEAEIFEKGARADWDTTLERATGERLNPRYFVEEFVVA